MMEFLAGAIARLFLLLLILAALFGILLLPLAALCGTIG